MKNVETLHATSPQPYKGIQTKGKDYLVCKMNK
jgi:hypothetical protein